MATVIARSADKWSENAYTESSIFFRGEDRVVKEPTMAAPLESKLDLSRGYPFCRYPVAERCLSAAHRQEHRGQ